MNNFKKIYSEYKNQVYFFVKKYISGSEDIEDVVQEIFIHLWKYNHQLANTNLIEQIIFKTAKQEISNFYRKNKLVFCYSEEISDLKTPQSEEGYDESFNIERIKKIENLIEKLPQKTKEFFLKNKLENISYAKLAKEHNISKTAVEKHINRAIKFVRTNALFFL